MYYCIAYFKWRFQTPSQHSSLTLVFHAPLQLYHDRLPGQLIQEGLGIYGRSHGAISLCSPYSPPEWYSLQRRLSQRRETREMITSAVKADFSRTALRIRPLSISKDIVVEQKDNR